ncbi:MAG: membrane protein insertase YidC [Pseudomonadales bacterium]
MDIQRVVILIGLAITSYLLVLAWNEDYGQSSQDKPVPAQVASSPEAGQQSSDVPDQLPEAEGAEMLPEVDEEIQPTPTEDPYQDSVRSNRVVSVKTDVLEISIDTRGGDIVRGTLPAYPAELKTPDVPFLLIDPRNNYAAQSGLIGPDGTDQARGRPVFNVSRSNYEMGNEDELHVDLTLTTEKGVDIIKRFKFKHGDYLVEIEYIIDNRTESSWQGALFAQIKRDGKDPVVSEGSRMGLQPYVGAATFTPDTPYTKLEFDDIAETPYKSKVDGGYMAMVQHYFVTAWIPKGDNTYTWHARKLSGNDIYLFGFTTPLWTVGPGEIASKSALFYAGPKDQYRLEEIAQGLSLTVDYGFLWWLAQPLFYLLDFIHGMVHNWGVAIILLTVIVKLLLYPLSAASFKSMAKMRKLQPEMARLKERYGDDKQKFSQAMMDLYKKEGANPLGGCLPILLQMPVFLALYWTLMESVELRQAPFILWIDDLSAMDPYFVLPILMGISMYLTQMLQPEPPDPVQAKIFKMMPIMFTFFFLWFPSGLVLYWLTNNILSIAQQWFVTRQLETGK